MGIRPNGSGAIPPVTPDNPETRYSDWLTDLEDSGEIVGGVWQETDAKATSASNGLSDLAGRVKNLEDADLAPHQHASADISDTTSFVDSTMGQSGRIPRTGTGGWLYSRDNPTHANHLARKGYVDSEVQKVSQRIDSHEQIASMSGTGWTAYKKDGLVMLTLSGASAGFTLPEGYRPPVQIFSPISYSRDSVNARLNITSSGVLEFLGEVPNPVFATVMYIAAPVTQN